MAGKLVKEVSDTIIFTVQTGYFYNHDDCWAQVEDSTAKVGISEYVQKSKAPIVFLETIGIGSQVNQCQEIGKVETIKGTVTLFSPVTGRVMEVNRKLKPLPHLINRDPYGEGWIYRIKLSNFEADRVKLLNAEDYFATALTKFAECRARIQSRG